MPRPSLLLAALLTLAALVACGRPPEPLPTPVPRTPVPLSPNAISPENARQVTLLQCEGAGWAHQLAFSPDGTLLAITAGPLLALYDTSPLSEPRFLDPHVSKPHPIDMTAVAFSTDGRMLATGLADGGIHLWDPVDGTLIRTLGQHGDRVIALAFSADGRTLASAGWDSALRIWDVADGTLLDTFGGPVARQYRGGPDCWMPAAFSPDGALVAWGCDRNLGLYRVRDGVRLRDLSIPILENARALAFSPDGTMLAVGTEKRTRIWQMDAAGQLSARDLRFGGPLSLAFSHDGQFLGYGGYQGTGLLSLADGKHAVVLCCKHKDNIYATGLSPDGTLLVTGSVDGNHCFWGVQP